MSDLRLNRITNISSLLNIATAAYKGWNDAAGTPIGPAGLLTAWGARTAMGEIENNIRAKQYNLQFLMRGISERRVINIARTLNVGLATSQTFGGYTLGYIGYHTLK
jgi:hypothetical protein